MPPTGIKWKSTKSEGTYSVCSKVCRLFSDGGIVFYRHGPHESPCAGSGRPSSEARPSGTTTSPQPGTSGFTASSQPQPSQGLSHPGSQVDPVQVSGGASVAFAHPTSFGPVLKHIPKAARPACSAHLTTLLTGVTDNSGEVERWFELLHFGSRVLYKPTRGGRRHNLANAIKARCEPDYICCLR